MLCTHCGTVTPDNSRACEHCGRPTGVGTSTKAGGGQTGLHSYAVTGLVCAIAGPLTCGIGSLFGLAFGLTARRRIAESMGEARGSGLALAAVIISAATLGLLVVFVLLGSVLGDESP